tara:strand:+ start:125 stop:346 length:222 start_codon:yes stop_codon:yes gene_type:complete
MGVGYIPSKVHKSARHFIVETESGITAITYSDVSCITRKDDGTYDIHMRSGTIFTTDDLPTLSHGIFELLKDD